MGSGWRARFHGITARASRWLRLEDRSIRGRWIVALHGVFFVALVSFSLRTFLAGHGYILYHNVAWPISSRPPTAITSVFAPDLWTSNGADPAGYGRSWAMAVPVAIGDAAKSSLVGEKAYYLWAFLVEYVLAFVAASLFLRFYPTRFRGTRLEAVRFGFVGLTFVNPAALQWEAGGLVPFLWAAPLLLIAVLSTLLALRLHSSRYAALAGVVLGAGATLDPRLFVWGWMILGALLLLALAVPRQRWNALGRGVVAVVTSLPGAAVGYFSYVYGGQATSALRPTDYAAIAGLSANSGGLRVFELTGYFISEITYAPPSVFAYPNLGTLPSLGNPTYALTTADPVAAIWWLAFAAIPVLAFSALMFGRERGASLPFALMAVGGIGLAAGTQLPIPGVVSAEVALGHAPLFGVIWQTVIGVPIYVQVVTEAAYIPLLILATLGLLRLLSAAPGAPPIAHSLRLSRSLHVTVHLRRDLPHLSARRAQLVATGLIVVVVVFASWQFFTGDFAPGGYSVGASPNGVPALGSAAPAAVPAGDTLAANQFASDPTPYAVFWPGASGFPYTWSNRSTPSFSADGAKPVANPMGIAYLVEHNLSFDTASLLAAYGVRYVVLDNMSSLALAREFGTNSLSRILDFFNSSPGITEVRAAPPDSWEFEVRSTPNLLAGASAPVAYDAPSDLLGVSTGILGELGLDPVLSPALPPSGAALRFLGNSSGGPPDLHTLLVATAENLSTAAAPAGVEGFTPNGTLAPASFSTSQRGEFGLPAPYANWTISVWTLPSGAVNLTVNRSVGLTLDHVGASATTSLNYLSSLVDGSYRGIPVDPRSPATFRVSVEARANGTGSGTTQMNVIASNASAVNLEQLNAAPVGLTSNWSQVSFIGALPVGTALFTLRLFTTFQGSIELRNVTIDWAQLTPEGSTFSGSAMPIAARTPLTIPLGTPRETVDVAVDLAGRGVPELRDGTQWRTGPSLTPSFAWWVALNVTLNGSVALQVSGPSEVAGLAVVPDSLSVPPSCSVADEAMSSGARFSASVNAAPNCWLVLHEPYSAEWRLARSGGSESGEVDFLGDTAFPLSPGSYPVTISLAGSSALPVAIAGFGVYTVAVPILLVVIPKGWMRRRRA